MSKRAVECFLIDILIACNKISRYTSDIENARQLLASEIIYDAVIKELEVVGEAANHVLRITPEKCPEYFRKIVDFRNILTHEYFGIAIDEVWSIIQNQFPDLHTDVVKILYGCEKSVVSEVIQCALQDSIDSKHGKTESFLNGLLMKFKS